MHRARIEFDVDCEFLGPQSGRFVAAFSIYADNKGQVEHRFDEIRLRVRGIRRDSPLLDWGARAPLLAFPEEIIARANVVPPEFGYFFARPGVRQRVSFVTSVPSDQAFLLARVTFRYKGSSDLHTAERAFEVPRLAAQPRLAADCPSAHHGPRLKPRVLRASSERAECRQDDQRQTAVDRRHGSSRGRDHGRVQPSGSARPRHAPLSDADGGDCHFRSWGCRARAKPDGVGRRVRNGAVHADERLEHVRGSGDAREVRSAAYGAGIR
jgi:hypothetical protein